MTGEVVAVASSPKHTMAKQTQEHIVLPHAEGLEDPREFVHDLKGFSDD